MDTTEQKFRAEYEELQTKLADSSFFSAPEYVPTAKRQTELAPLIELYDRRRQLREDLQALNDPELVDMAVAERPALEAALIEVEEKLRLALVPKDPHDSKDVIVEIRAGAGGDESTLFAAELYRAYARYAETRGWKVEIDSESPSDVGGYKEIVFEIHGENVYAEMKYESGVHRVQRVPATESQGRVHTSTVTVAVLPEAEETELEINEADLRIDVYRSSGHGGQSVNTTDSAVRITHVPTGVVVTMQDEKSQLKNKQKAMGVLRSRLLAAKAEEEMRSNREARLAQIGTGDRSEKIRTYNFPQDRITDHRIGRTQHGLPGFMAGNIGDMTAALQAEDLKRKLAEAAG
ncbi:MAG TPA: peptide chain release factor 1 [Candidatus Saccharimonadales bacterium]|nr:peptide chain release factor 1 [Candidatus Saccharimonadales bacterium]